VPDFRVPDFRVIVALLVLAGQALLVHLAGMTERLPRPPDFAHFPAMISDWKFVWEDPIAPDVVDVLKADDLLSRTYVQLPAGESTANLFVAWFSSQVAGEKQPHSPQVCLPAAGWMPEVSDTVPLETSAGPITPRRYIAASRTQRAVILYWYQTPRRAVAGEWAAKLWLVPDALRDHRSDTALVRVMVYAKEKGDVAANAAAMEFARSVYPILRTALPH